MLAAVIISHFHNLVMPDIFIGPPYVFSQHSFGIHEHPYTWINEHRFKNKKRLIHICMGGTKAYREKLKTWIRYCRFRNPHPICQVLSYLPKLGLFRLPLIRLSIIVDNCQMPQCYTTTAASMCVATERYQSYPSQSVYCKCEAQAGRCTWKPKQDSDFKRSLRKPVNGIRPTSEAESSSGWWFMYLSTHTLVQARLGPSCWSSFLWTRYICRGHRRVHLRRWSRLQSSFMMLAFISVTIDRFSLFCNWTRNSIRIPLTYGV